MIQLHGGQVVNECRADTIVVSSLDPNINMKFLTRVKNYKHLIGKGAFLNLIEQMATLSQSNEMNDDDDGKANADKNDTQSKLRESPPPKPVSQVGLTLIDRNWNRQQPQQQSRAFSSSCGQSMGYLNVDAFPGIIGHRVPLPAHLNISDQRRLSIPEAHVQSPMPSNYLLGCQRVSSMRLASLSPVPAAENLSLGRSISCNTNQRSDSTASGRKRNLSDEETGGDEMNKRGITIN